MPETVRFASNARVALDDASFRGSVRIDGAPPELGGLYLGDLRVRSPDRVPCRSTPVEGAADPMRAPLFTDFGGRCWSEAPRSIGASEPEACAQ